MAHDESYVEGLRYELRGAIEKADKAHEKAVRAELDRVAPAPQKAPETREIS